MFQIVEKAGDDNPVGVMEKKKDKKRNNHFVLCGSRVKGCSCVISPAGDGKVMISNAEKTCEENPVGEMKQKKTKKIQK